MKGSTSTRIRALQSVAFQPNYLVQRFFGDFIPWQYRDIPLKRATDTNWMNTYRRGRGSRLAVDADLACSGPARIRTCRTTRRR